MVRTIEPIHDDVDFVKSDKLKGDPRSGTYVINIDRDRYAEGADDYTVDIARAIHKHSDNGDLLTDEWVHDTTKHETSLVGRTIQFGSRDKSHVTLHGSYPIESFAHNLDDLSTTAGIHEEKYRTSINRPTTESKGKELWTKLTSLAAGGVTGMYVGVHAAAEAANRILPSYGQDSNAEIAGQWTILLGVTAGIGLLGTWAGNQIGRLGWNSGYGSKYHLAKDKEAISNLKSAAIGGRPRQFVSKLLEKIDVSARGD